MKASNPGSPPEIPEVLHYVGYDVDRGGIVSIIRALSGEGRFRCVLGGNRGFRQLREPALPAAEFSPVEGETLGLQTFVRARRVAEEVRRWLSEDPRRVFHGHSRAGLAVSLWLARMGEARSVASVHCYGRRRWFYRWSKGRMGRGLVWLSPSMKRYYGYDAPSWADCIPGCVGAEFVSPGKESSRGAVVRLGGIGALVPWKRWDLILRALASLPEELRRRFHFTHIGSTDGSALSEACRASLITLTRDLGLSGSVTWAGERPSSLPFLREIDCLVIGSENEPFSIAMLEALSCGVPVLAPDSGGARDVVSPPGNGWLFRSSDAGDLSSRLALLAGGIPFGVSEAARRSAERFHPANVAAEWLAVYEAILAGE